MKITPVSIEYSCILFFLFSLRRAELWSVTFSLANMSAHNCGEKPSPRVLSYKARELAMQNKDVSHEEGWEFGILREQMQYLGYPDHSQAWVSHRRNQMLLHPVCSWQFGIEWRGLMHYLQRYYHIILWASLPKPIALPTWHPKGPLCSHRSTDQMWNGHPDVS